MFTMKTERLILMAKKISFGLSVNEINKAVKELEKYKSDLNRKCEELCRRLIAAGNTVALQNINDSPLGKTITLGSEITPEKAGCRAILFSTGQIKSNEYGEINTLLLVEFGAGIHYNSVENPKAPELGMGVGSFPGQLHAFDENGWYYMGDDGQWHHSYGVKATMPMYKTGKEMREQVVKIAREVFKS